MTGTYNVDDDDELVVIQGSALYEHMLSLGYSDFEVASASKYQENNDNSPVHKGFLCYIKTAWEKLYSVFSWITQAENTSRQQLCIITNAKALLDDHAHMIKSSLEEFHISSWRGRTHNWMLTSSVIISLISALLDKRHRFFNMIFVSSSLLVVTCVKYQRVCAKRNLESLIELQNETLDLCKKSLRSLRYGYRIAPSRLKSSSQFYALNANRLKYFQPITESVVKCMESMSHIYYKVSLILLKLLPQDNLEVFTQFENKSLNVQGEVTYQELKELYHIYILTQSEMLYLLSIAYNVNTWRESHCFLPEKRLSYIVYNLLKYLRIYRDNLLIVMKAYYNVGREQSVQIHATTIDKKWQDLYVHLHLTSNKLQSAYNHILSILQDIDCDMKDATIDENSAETMMQKLNQAYQEIDGARNFAEFSSLLIARTRINNRPDSVREVNALPLDTNTEPGVIHDAEPQIVDEVFEEYIKEEYLKPLCEEGVDASFEDYKWDKFLAKNFLLELKDALIDKKKSMSERESKALQRMYQNVIKDMDLKGNITGSRIPTPPPLPNKNEEPLKSADKNTVPPFKQKYTVDDKQQNANEEPLTISFIPLPKIESQLPLTQLAFPPSFIKGEEETFIGSGENSEEEQSEDEIEETSLNPD